jgi:hypothetical protein
VLYESNYTALTVLVRPESVQYHGATGVEIARTKALTVDFGTHGGEIPIVNPLTGETERHALMHGRFYDTEEAKERFGWDDEEHESVVMALDKLCREQPFIIAKVEFHQPEIVRPWPTYDEAHWKTIPTLAQTLGLTETALVYERANKNRETVVAALEAQMVEHADLPESAPLPREDLITLES